MTSDNELTRVDVVEGTRADNIHGEEIAIGYWYRRIPESKDEGTSDDEDQLEELHVLMASDDQEDEGASADDQDDDDDSGEESRRDDHPELHLHGDEQRADPDDGWIGCVVEVGSNYIQLKAVDDSSLRVHLDNVDQHLVRIPDPGRLIERKTALLKSQMDGYMREVVALTSRLGVASAGALTTGSEVAALALRPSSEPVGDYKAALELAHKTTLPDLFSKIESTGKRLSLWMKAPMLPMRAQAEAMKSSLKKIESRIFNVELYAGLIEQVERIADGEPASLEEPIRLFQRRAYMDEECLARYEAGGMDFAGIPAFDRWLTRHENITRLLPFPRCALAFQVRRKVKERERPSDLGGFIRILAEEKADMQTFLYMRNGEQVYRLDTAIDFGEKLFPDLDHIDKLGGGALLWAEHGYMHGTRILTDAEYQGLLEEEARELRKWNELPKNRRIFPPRKESTRFKRFDKDNLYYDEIARHIASQIEAHNRLVIVLQGLLDRSPVFHPHPPWSLWSESGMRALDLIYDDSRALVGGAAPDFEAYRARLNASLKVGDVTVGQEHAWMRSESKKELHRLRNGRHRWGYDQERFHPELVRPWQSPGPGLVGRVVAVSKRAKTCSFEWERKRERQQYGKPEMMTERLSLSIGKILNISAYTPGDFQIFFSDPWTRANYLEWAPLLLVAEEYHAGQRTVGLPGDERDPLRKKDNR
jgi:hypothetical protein